MKTYAAIGLVALGALALGCHEASLRLRDFHDRDLAQPDPDRDASAQPADAGDASSPSDVDADVEPPCSDASACEADAGDVPPSCEQVVCGDDAICTETVLGARCDCMSGYEEGDGGCTDVDECMRGLATCDELTSCRNDRGGYRCSACPETYLGDGATGCAPLLASLVVTPRPVLAPVALEVAQPAHTLRFPLAVDRVEVTAAFLPARSAKVLGNGVSSGEPWTSPLLRPGPNWIPIEVSEGARVHNYVIEAQRGRQEAYIKASNTDPYDWFGAAVAISGGTLVVGAPGESGAYGGVDAPQGNGALEAGAAYVFVRSGATWVQEAYLKASSPSLRDAFGTRVAIDGDTIVVGAPYESSAPRGSAEPTNDDLRNSGAAYVFVRAAGVWSQQAMLKASNAGSDDTFGSGISISGDTIVVGAPGEDGSATGVGGNGLLEGADNSGAAYVFERMAGVWTERAYVKASNTGAGDAFGDSVVVRGDTLIATAPLEDSGAAGVNGDQESDAGYNSGAVYIFARGEGLWSQSSYVKSSKPEPEDVFGLGIAFDGTTLVVGAPGESSSRGGINSPDSDNGARGSGAAYLFVQQDGQLRQIARVKPRTPRASSGFAASMAVQGERMMIGAGDSSAARLFGGDETDDSMPYAGAAYLFERTSIGWRALSYVKPEHPSAGDLFGRMGARAGDTYIRDHGCIAIEGDTLVVGAFLEGSNARGVNGDAENEGAPGSGAVYVFR